MSDNSLMTGADTVRDKDRSGVKTQIVGLDLGIGTGTENLMTGTMPVSGTVTPANAGDVATTLTSGRKTSSSVGTAVALRATLACKWVQVTALVTNTTRVYVGGTGTLATAGSQAGTPLAAGESVTIPVADAATVLLDVLTSGEGVSFLVGA